MNITTPNMLQGLTPPPVGGASRLGRGLLGGGSGLGETGSKLGGLAAGGKAGDDFGSIVRGRMGVLQAQQVATAGVAAKTEDAERRQQVDEAATGLVSNALILPILKQLRRSPWGGEGVFSAGIGEKTFGPEFDMQLADRIAQSPRLGIKKALADRMMKRSPQAATGAIKKTGLDVNG